MLRPPANTLLAIYNRDEWDDLRQLCDDLPGTYDEWLADVQSGLQEMELTYDGVTKVMLRADQIRLLYNARGRCITLKERLRLAHRLHLETRTIATRH